MIPNSMKFLTKEACLSFIFFGMLILSPIAVFSCNDVVSNQGPETDANHDDHDDHDHDAENSSSLDADQNHGDVSDDGGSDGGGGGSEDSDVFDIIEDIDARPSHDDPDGSGDGDDEGDGGTGEDGSEWEKGDPTEGRTCDELVSGFLGCNTTAEIGMCQKCRNQNDLEDDDLFDCIEDEMDTLGQGCN